MSTSVQETGRTVSPPRRLRIQDALFLIVPLGVGLALFRGLDFHATTTVRIHSDNATSDWVKLAAPILGLASRVVAMEMLGLLLLQLRPPRPRPRRLTRQPGFVACAAAAAGMTAGGISGIALAVLGQPHLRFLNNALFNLLPQIDLVPTQVTSWSYVEAGITPAIVTAWIAQALGRRWRPEPTLLDRAGRVLGAYWILLGAYRLIMPWFEPSFWILPR
jgi:hypothetical protein